MGTSKKQKKREWLRYRDFVLSPYGVIKIKSLCYIIHMRSGVCVIHPCNSTCAPLSGATTCVMCLLATRISLGCGWRWWITW
ncbi:hypothetical protein [Symbiopectobacterium sp. RP]|uniref:hypothetical protein n=1 Tax=Symbiopectobacterium sp. RP TaxID=3248553 RepID=UPI003D291841